MPQTFMNRFSMKPIVERGSDGSRLCGPAPDFVAGKIYAYNDSQADVWLPGMVIITGIATDFGWRAGKLGPPPDDAGFILIAGDIGSNPTSFASQPVLGISTGFNGPGGWGELAISGIVPVRCNDASVDTPLKSFGTWVRLSANLDDTGTLSGNVESMTPTQLVSGTPATSTPGIVIGQVVIPAGTAFGATQSNFYCIVELKLR